MSDQCLTQHTSLNPQGPHYVTWPFGSRGLAEDMAALLIEAGWYQRSDADQAVLDAADDMADMHGRYDECFPIPCRLCVAVRARRERP